MLYGQSGIDYWAEVGTQIRTRSTCQSLLGSHQDRLRSICKLLVLMALNAK